MTNSGLLATQIGDLLGRSMDTGTLPLQRSAPWAPEQLAGSPQLRPFAELFQSQDLTSTVPPEHESIPPGHPGWLHNLLISHDFSESLAPVLEPLALDLPTLAPAPLPGLAEPLTALPQTPASETLLTPDQSQPTPVPASANEISRPGPDGRTALPQGLPEPQLALPVAGNSLPLAGKGLPIPAAPAAGGVPQPAADTATAFVPTEVPAPRLHPHTTSQVLATERAANSQPGREPAPPMSPVKAEPESFAATRTTATSATSATSATARSFAAPASVTTQTSSAPIALAETPAAAATLHTANSATTPSPLAATPSAPAPAPAATGPETGLPDAAGAALRAATEHADPEVLRPTRSGQSTMQAAPQLTPEAATIQRASAKTNTLPAPETATTAQRSGPTTPAGIQPAIATPDTDFGPVQSAAPADPLAVSSSLAAISGRDGTATLTATSAQTTQVDTQSAAAWRQAELTADPKATSQHLAQQISVLARDGVQTARVQLYPEHLGQVDVRIRIDDEGTFINLHAHTTHGRDALDASLHRLRDMCAEQGLNLSEANVSFGEERTSQQSFRDRTAPSGHSRAWTDASNEAEQTVDLPTPRQASNRLVDILA